MCFNVGANLVKVSNIIEVNDVSHRFGDVRALQGLSLEIEQGEVRGLLGPNGAGKTTLVRLLATLLRVQTGSAKVGGFDLTTQAGMVRKTIGLAGQAAAVDEFLTGRENLEIVGRLYQLGKKTAKRRADETLERLGLTEAADRTVKTYSGGMRRRLDLGASLVGHPKILLLDEPTTGLDPRTRQQLWDFLRTLQDQGTTVLLTTQYLEEADALADSITVIDRGTVIAEGTPESLKQRVGGDYLLATPANQQDCSQVVDVLSQVGESPARLNERLGQVSVPVTDRVAALVAVSQQVEEHGIVLADLAVQRPTLDDVFLALTGQPEPDSVSSPGRVDQ